jgi:ankyrin repeat protein
LTQNKDWIKNSSLVTEVLIYSFFRSNELSYYLLNSFPELHSHQIDGMPLTVYAYKQGNSAVFSLLIKLGVAMDYSGFRGQLLPSLLTWQYFNADYPQQIHQLIQRGFDINATDERGDTAMHMAVYLGWAERVLTLTGVGADINQVNNKGNTPLIYAAQSGKFAMVKKLINNGADLKLINKQQKNAAQSAEESGFKDIAKFLYAIK